MKPTTWIVSALLVCLLKAPPTFADSSKCEILSESETWSEAFKACKKSADTGSPKAQFYLAEMYAAGKGVEEDSVKALKLFERAASNGVGLARTTCAWQCVLLCQRGCFARLS
jgi:TPR repeat protein